MDHPLGSAGQWNDVKETNRLYYVIEYVDNQTGIAQISSERPVLQVFPNPASSKITVILPDQWVSQNSAVLKIFSLSGRLVRTVVVENNPIQMEVDDLTKGVYFIRFENSVLTGRPSKLIISNQ